jgi:MraZ protein
MLFGEYSPAIDSQYRISIPAKFRSELGEQFIIVRHMKIACLRIYSKSSWDEYLASIKSQLNRGSYERALHFYYRHAVEGTPDSLGRVRVPKELWESIEVDFENGVKDITIIGCGEYGEIWAKGSLDNFDGDLDLDALSAEIEGCAI